MRLALKVDVDTLRGTEEGVPRLARLGKVRGVTRARAWGLFPTQRQSMSTTFPTPRWWQGTRRGADVRVGAYSRRWRRGGVVRAARTAASTASPASVFMWSGSGTRQFATGQPGATTMPPTPPANAPIAVKFALEATNKGLETSQSEGQLLEASYFGLCAATEDKNEGTTAFLEKRAPRFQGR